MHTSSSSAAAAPAPRAGRRLRWLLAFVVLAIAPLAAPAAVAGAQPAAWNQQLYERGDFVSQTNTVQCVGASIQMMLNMVRVTNDRTAATQLDLQQLARANSPRRQPSDALGTVRPRRGASAVGWAASLTQLGAGPYTIVAEPTIEAALLRAAGAIRITGRPVGLLVWRGAHAWVLGGFSATADPVTAGARVTSVTVLDPWYPRVSRTWGASPQPGSRLSVRQLSADFVPWRRGHRHPEWDGRYILVVPYGTTLSASGPMRAI